MGGLSGEGPGPGVQGGPRGVHRDPPEVMVGHGHGRPRKETVVESGGQWVPRADPRFLPGPGVGHGHGRIVKVEKEGQGPF